MPGQSVPIAAALAAFYRGQFAVTDVLRRAHGNALGTWGLDPSECPHRTAASGSFWRLRDYGRTGGSPAVLIVAAPIKRPYIWDLAPSVSAIRYCLGHGLRVYLLEWRPPARDTGNYGLAECAHAISECLTTISGEGAGAKPALAGHSLGGTVAAIFAALAPDHIRGLLLLGAPLCFQPATSRFRDALVALIPSTLSAADSFPGSLLSHMSALAAPRTFIWSRHLDAVLSIADPRALDIHARVERWALDEVPLAGQFVHQVVEWLYREDRFCRGALKIGDRLIGPSSLSAPTLAVVNTADEVAPLGSLKPFTDAMPAETARIIEYHGEIGVCLQHLGVLVGRVARAQVWPEIVAWLKALGDATAARPDTRPG